MTSPRHGTPWPRALALCLAMSAPAFGHPGHEDEAQEVVALRAKVAQLEASLVDSDKQLAALSESLATSNAQADENRDNYERLRAQSEALGLSVLEGTGGVQERLLAALNEVRRLEETNRAVTKLLDSLYGAAREALNDAPPSAAPSLSTALADVEAHYQAQNSKPVFAAQDVSKAKIIGMKQELGLIVLNVGKNQGVKPGMPLQIMRRDQPIAPALVVEVRDQICGAVCQTSPDIFRQVQLGDGVTLELSR